jgi:hypothetical protein
VEFGVKKDRNEDDAKVLICSNFRGIRGVIEADRVRFMVDRNIGHETKPQPL